MINWIEQNIPFWFFIAIIVHLGVLGTVAYLILLERKVASWVQDRVGPNRTGFDFGLVPLKFKFWGLGQPLADGLKFLVKEDYQPRGVDRALFTLAPMIMMLVVIVSVAVIPWGGIKGNAVVDQPLTEQLAAGQGIVEAVNESLPNRHRIVSDITLTITPPVTPGSQPAQPVSIVIDAAGELTPAATNPAEIIIPRGSVVTASYVHGWNFQIANLNIGVLYVLSVLSLAVYGVVIGGWASNNKYSFLGGLRATANMISYEIPLGISVLAIVVLYGTLDLASLVEVQAHYWWGFIPAWNIFVQPVAFLLFLVCIHAEANRAPFDLAEAEQELVGGYHTEYSSMRFALFFLAEYAGMITTSAVCVALFFGGWHFPGLTGNVSELHPSVTTSLVECVIRSLVFFAKTLAILFIFIWVRWSLPRFRFDQLMGLAWRGLIPLSLMSLVGTVAVIWFFAGAERLAMRVSPAMAIALIVMNVVLVLIAVFFGKLLPAAPPINRKIAVANSRFNTTPLPAGVTQPSA